jgi:hypothetical protein
MIPVLIRGQNSSSGLVSRLARTRGCMFEVAEQTKILDSARRQLFYKWAPRCKLVCLSQHLLDWRLRLCLQVLSSTGKQSRFCCRWAKIVIHLCYNTGLINPCGSWTVTAIQDPAHLPMVTTIWELTPLLQTLPNGLSLQLITGTEFFAGKHHWITVCRFNCDTNNLILKSSCSFDYSATSKVWFMKIINSM